MIDSLSHLLTQTATLLSAGFARTTSSIAQVRRVGLVALFHNPSGIGAATWRECRFMVSVCCRMTDKLHIHMGSSSQVVLLPSYPLPPCKEVVDTLGGGTLLDGDDLVLHSRILEAGKHYTVFKEVTAGKSNWLSLHRDCTWADTLLISGTPQHC